MSRSRRSPRQQADDDAEYYDRLREREQRQRDTEAMKLGASGVPDSALPAGGITSRMSRADQNNVASRIKQVRGGSLSDPTQTTEPTQIMGARRNAGAEQGTNASVSGSRVPLDANSPARLQAGAVAASPSPATPPANRFVAPAPLTSPMGNATTDAAALKQNLAIAQNPGSFQSPMQSSPQVAGSKPAAPSVASVGIGKTLTPAQGDALFGEVQGPNGYGTGSVRIAGKNERTGPSLVTDTGVVGQAPARDFNHDAARAALYKSSPEVFVAGSPANRAFLKHVEEQKASGLPLAQAQQSAFENADSIVAPTLAKAPAAGRSGSPGKGADALLAAQADAENASQPAPVRAGRAIARSGNAARDLGNTIANAPRTAAKAIDSAISGVATGLTGRPQTLNPIASAGRAVKSFVAPVVGAVANASSNVLKNIPNPATQKTASPLADPTQQPAPSIVPSAPPKAPVPIAETPEEKARKRRLPAFSMN